MSLIPEALRRGYEATLTPVVDQLVARRVSPNAITTVGTVLLLGAGVAFGVGSVRMGGALLLLSGILDTLDGRVARATGGTSRFGAFYDSTLDRIGEAALFTGIALFFMQGGTTPEWRPAAVFVTLLALSAGLIVSYARARAEGLGLECKVGFAQRAERIAGLGIPSVLFAAGPNGYLLLAIVTVLALLSAVTVVQRIYHVYRLTRPKSRRTQARTLPPEMTRHP